MANKDGSLTIDGLDHFSNDAFRNFLCHVGVKLIRFSLEEERENTSQSFIVRSGDAFSPVSDATKVKMQFFQESILVRAMIKPKNIIALWRSSWKLSEPSVVTAGIIETHLIEILRKKIQLTSFPVRTMLFLYAVLFPDGSTDDSGEIIVRRRDFLLLKLRCLYDEIIQFQKNFLRAVLTPIGENEVFAYFLHLPASPKLHQDNELCTEIPEKENKQRVLKKRHLHKTTERIISARKSPVKKQNSPVPMPSLSALNSKNSPDEMQEIPHVTKNDPFPDVDETKMCFEHRVILAWYRSKQT